ncbi:preprotein translocase subunit YajC [Halonatronum saccharophilum]|uniref:preprotein translocase subunit YajC n=1 Tax=Halonatronum saccharophilum TaxID=150060 RepID=UPI000489401A|nr:preprotein translocase subunit YajC [Halonatronum saccharophilum]
MELLAGLIPWIFMFGVFWFLLIRPQKKQQQRHQEMLAKLKVGDKVVTIGGIKGQITEIEDDQLKVEIAPEVKVEMNRGAIGRLDREVNTEAKA